MVILQLEEQPQLIQAIFAGDFEQARSLLECKENVNYQDYEKRSALHAAAFKGDVDMTKLLIEHGARVNTKDSKWLTPLHRACCTGSEETVSVLLNHSADTSARDRQWQTPLHIAAAHNALPCVASLLEKVPNPNVTDRSGRTALHHAVLNGHNEVVYLLLSKGCVVNACDKKDCRPIHWAAHMGHIDTIELLLRNGADINARDRNQYTPLHVAAASGMVTACRVLITYGAEVDSQNAYGNTPLHIACLNGHVPVCQELVEYDCDKEAINFRGQTPLHIAAASTHGVHCLNYLVGLKVNINKQSLDRRTPLHMTAIHGRFTRSKTLIDRGAIVDCVDKNGCAALHIAAQHGHELLSNTLLSYGADASKRGHEGRTPLHMCCLSGYVECCRTFIKAGIDINCQDDSGKTPIHCASYKGSVECLDLLVSSGADLKVLDNIGRTALHYAAVQGYFVCVFTLVGIGSPVNQADSEGCTALHLAAAYDLEGRCVDYLIQHKADPKLRDKNGFTSIHYAVAGNNTCGLKFLLDSCGNNYLLYGNDMPLTTPLHIAAKNGNMEILEKLMPYFPDPNIKNEHGVTPLLLAARQGFASSVQLLLRFGAKVSICDSIYNMSPVHHSAKNGHVHCLALLVDNTEDKSIINLPDKLERTALMLAVSNSHADCVMTLIKSGADLNIIDSDCHSCLFRAVVTGQHNILQMLLPRSLAINKPDINGKTVLHLAAACGRVSCLQRILHYMDRNVAAGLDHQNFTALHWACYSGSSECVEHLLKENVFKKLDGNQFSAVHCATSAGSEKCLRLLCAHFGPDIVRLRDMRHRTPLHIASLRGHTECAIYLMQQRAEIDCQDEDGRTPLIAAAQHGQVQVMEILISYKADMTSYDKNGNTALHLACLQKHNHAALLLLEYIDDPDIINMINNDRKTPLHLSARNGLVDVTRQLILKGSCVMAVDGNGLTPALCCAPDQSVAQCLAIILASYPLQFNLNDNSKKVIPDLQIFKTTSLIDKLKSQKCQTSQTDMSLIKNPDQFELEQLFGMKFNHSESDKYSKEELMCLTSSIVQNFFGKGHAGKAEDEKQMPRRKKIRSPKIVNDSSCFIIENYDESGDSFAENPAFCGRDLHKSQSDMTLTTRTIYSEEDYGRIIQHSRPKEEDNVNDKKFDNRNRGAIRKNTQLEQNREQRTLKAASIGKLRGLSNLRVTEFSVDAHVVQKQPSNDTIKGPRKPQIVNGKDLFNDVDVDTLQSFTFQNSCAPNRGALNSLEPEGEFILKKFLESTTINVENDDAIIDPMCESYSDVQGKECCVEKRTGLDFAKSLQMLKRGQPQNIKNIKTSGPKRARSKKKSEKGSEDDENLCHLCKLASEKVVNSDFKPELIRHYAPTLERPKEELIANRDNNRCLRAFLDQSYDINDANKEAIYHGMLHPQCEPYMARLLHLPQGRKFQDDIEAIVSDRLGVSQKDVKKENKDDLNVKTIELSTKEMEKRDCKSKTNRLKDTKTKDYATNKLGLKTKPESRPRVRDAVKSKECKSCGSSKHVTRTSEVIKTKEGLKVRDFKARSKEEKGTVKTKCSLDKLKSQSKVMEDTLNTISDYCDHILKTVKTDYSSYVIDAPISNEPTQCRERDSNSANIYKEAKSDFVIGWKKKSDSPRYEHGQNNSCRGPCVGKSKFRKQIRNTRLTASDVMIGDCEAAKRELCVTTYVDGCKIEKCGENSLEPSSDCLERKPDNQVDAELQNNFSTASLREKTKMRAFMKTLTFAHISPMYINGDPTKSRLHCYSTFWCFPQLENEAKETQGADLENANSDDDFFSGCTNNDLNLRDKSFSESGFLNSSIDEFSGPNSSDGACCSTVVDIKSDSILKVEIKRNIVEDRRQKYVLKQANDEDTNELTEELINSQNKITKTTRKQNEFNATPLLEGLLDAVDLQSISHRTENRLHDEGLINAVKLDIPSYEGEHTNFQPPVHINSDSPELHKKDSSAIQLSSGEFINTAESSCCGSSFQASREKLYLTQSKKDSSLKEESSDLSDKNSPVRNDLTGSRYDRNLTFELNERLGKLIQEEQEKKRNKSNLDSNWDDVETKEDIKSTSAEDKANLSNSESSQGDLKISCSDILYDSKISSNFVEEESKVSNSSSDTFDNNNNHGKISESLSSKNEQLVSCKNDFRPSREKILSHNSVNSMSDFKMQFQLKEGTSDIGKQQLCYSRVDQGRKSTQQSIHSNLSQAANENSSCEFDVSAALNGVENLYANNSRGVQNKDDDEVIKQDINTLLQKLPRERVDLNRRGGKSLTQLVQQFGKETRHLSARIHKELFLDEYRKMTAEFDELCTETSPHQLDVRLAMDTMSNLYAVLDQLKAYTTVYGFDPAADIKVVAIHNELRTVRQKIYQKYTGKADEPEGVPTFSDTSCISDDIKLLELMHLKRNMIYINKRYSNGSTDYTDEDVVVIEEELSALENKIARKYSEGKKKLEECAAIFEETRDDEVKLKENADLTGGSEDSQEQLNWEMLLQTSKVEEDSRYGANKSFTEEKEVINVKVDKERKITKDDEKKAECHKIEGAENRETENTQGNIGKLIVEGVDKLFIRGDKREVTEDKEKVISDGKGQNISGTEKKIIKSKEKKIIIDKERENIEDDEDGDKKTSGDSKKQLVVQGEKRIVEYRRSCGQPELQKKLAETRIKTREISKIKRYKSLSELNKNKKDKGEKVQEIADALFQNQSKIRGISTDSLERSRSKKIHEETSRKEIEKEQSKISSRASVMSGSQIRREDFTLGSPGNCENCKTISTRSVNIETSPQESTNDVRRNFRQSSVVCQASCSEILSDFKAVEGENLTDGNEVTRIATTQTVPIELLPEENTKNMQRKLKEISMVCCQTSGSKIPLSIKLNKSQFLKDNFKETSTSRHEMFRAESTISVGNDVSLQGSTGDRQEKLEEREMTCCETAHSEVSLGVKSETNEKFLRENTACDDEVSKIVSSQSMDNKISLPDSKTNVQTSFCEVSLSNKSVNIKKNFKENTTSCHEMSKTVPIKSVTDETSLAKYTKDIPVTYQSSCTQVSLGTESKTAERCFKESTTSCHEMSSAMSTQSVGYEVEKVMQTNFEDSLMVCSQTTCPEVAATDIKNLNKTEINKNSLELPSVQAAPVGIIDDVQGSLEGNFNVSREMSYSKTSLKPKEVNKREVKGIVRSSYAMFNPVITVSVGDEISSIVCSQSDAHSMIQPREVIQKNIDDSSKVCRETSCSLIRDVEETLRENKFTQISSSQIDPKIVMDMIDSLYQRRDDIMRQRIGEDQSEDEAIKALNEEITTLEMKVIERFTSKHPRKDSDRSLSDLIRDYKETYFNVEEVTKDESAEDTKKKLKFRRFVREMIVEEIQAVKEEQGTSTVKILYDKQDYLEDGVESGECVFDPVDDDSYLDIKNVLFRKDSCAQHMSVSEHENAIRRNVRIRIKDNVVCEPEKSDTSHHYMKESDTSDHHKEIGKLAGDFSECEIETVLLNESDGAVRTKECDTDKNGNASASAVDNEEQKSSIKNRKGSASNRFEDVDNKEDLDSEPVSGTKERGGHVINWKLYLAHRNLLFNEDGPSKEDCLGRKSNTYKKYGTEESVFDAHRQQQHKTPTQKLKPEFRTRRSSTSEEDRFKESHLHSNLLIEECEGIIRIDDIIQSESKMIDERGIKKVIFSDKVNYSKCEEEADFNCYSEETVSEREDTHAETKSENSMKRDLSCQDHLLSEDDENYDTDGVIEENMFSDHSCDTQGQIEENILSDDIDFSDSAQDSYLEEYHDPLDLDILDIQNDLLDTVFYDAQSKPEPADLLTVDADITVNSLEIDFETSEETLQDNGAIVKEDSVIKETSSEKELRFIDEGTKSDDDEEIRTDTSSISEDQLESEEVMTEQPKVIEHVEEQEVVMTSKSNKVHFTRIEGIETEDLFNDKEKNATGHEEPQNVGMTYEEISLCSSKSEPEYRKHVGISGVTHIEENEKLLLLEAEKSDDLKPKSKKSFPSLSKLGKRAKKDSNCKIS